MAILTSKPWKNANITFVIRQEISYLLSNCTTAKVVRHDLDLHFQGHEFWKVNISKIVRANEKCSGTTFIEVDICNGMTPLRILYSVTLTYIFKVSYLKRLSKQLRELSQKYVMSFCRCWYSPSNGTIVNVVLHDLDLHFQGQTFFHCYAFAKKLRLRWMCQADFLQLARPSKWSCSCLCENMGSLSSKATYTCIPCLPYSYATVCATVNHMKIVWDRPAIFPQNCGFYHKITIKWRNLQLHALIFKV